MNLMCEECFNLPLNSPDLLSKLHELKKQIDGFDTVVNNPDLFNLLERDHGVMQRLLVSNLAECNALVEFCACLLDKFALSIKNFAMHNLYCAIIKCMRRFTDKDFWVLCHNSILCKISPGMLSMIQLVVSSIVDQFSANIEIYDCLTDSQVQLEHLKFLDKIIESVHVSNQLVPSSKLVDLYIYIYDIASHLRKNQAAFMLLLANSSSLILKAITSPVSKQTHFKFSSILSEKLQSSAKYVMRYFELSRGSSIQILQNLLKIHPQIFSEKPFQTVFVDFLLNLLRLTASNVEDLCMPTEAIKLFSTLLDEILKIGLNYNIGASAFGTLFDVLRAFPVNEAHSIARLFSWWKFLCVVPDSLLKEGFRRFVSPFLANLIGRYISITAFLGDPSLHRYKLSSASVYDGNLDARLLAMHVFSCFFTCPYLAVEAKHRLPKLQLSASLLTEHSYQLFVALSHWLRYESGVSKSTINVGKVWASCLQHVQRASKFLDLSVSFRYTFVSQLVKVSLRLVMPQDPSTSNVSFGSLIVPNKHDVSCNPSPTDSLFILQSIIDVLDNEDIPNDQKNGFKFNVCITSLNLCAEWHKQMCSSFDFQTNKCLDEMSGLAISLIDCDLRLVASSTDLTVLPGDDFVSICKDLLFALCPECPNYVSSFLLPEESQDSLPPSHVLPTLTTGLVNRAGLRVWNILAERLTQLILLHNRITEIPTTSTSSDSSVPLMSVATMLSFCLAPVFMTGSSVSGHSILSTDEETNVLRTLFNFFSAFHLEACLLTTISINAWIDSLGRMISELLTNYASDSPQKLNLNIVSYFLGFLGKIAEGVSENSTGRFSPSKWMARTDRPLGEVTGLLDAIAHCIYHLPLQTSEPFADLLRISPLTFGSPLASPKTEQSTDKGAGGVLRSLAVVTQSPGSGAGLLSPVRRQNAPLSSMHYQKSSSPSVALIAALESILQRHVRSSEALLEVIDRISPNLDNFSKRLLVNFKTLIGENVHIHIVFEFEALTILMWQSVQKYFSRANSPLQLPENVIRPIIAYFKPAVVLAQINSVRISKTPEKRSCQTSAAAKKQLSEFEAAQRRHSEYIACLGLIWDSLVYSISSDSPLSADLRVSMNELTRQFSRCMVKQTVPGTFNLDRRTFVPAWISRQCLLAGDDYNSGIENEPPQLFDASKSNLLNTSEKLNDDSDDEESNLSLAEFQERLKNKECSQKHVVTPVAVANGNRVLESRQIGTATTPRTRQRASQKIDAATRGISKRRLSLLSVASKGPKTPIRRSATNSDQRPNTTFMTPDVTEIPNNTPQKAGFEEGHIKRRLFDDMNPDSVTEKKTVSLKRTLTSRSPQSPNLPDFKDSVQFVFIPPINFSNKRIRLTDHQKERFREQKQSYIPSMYNELDTSQSLSEFQNSDSQSSMDSNQSSQSFAHFPPIQSKPKPITTKSANPSSVIFQETEDVNMIPDSESPFAAQILIPDSELPDKGECVPYNHSLSPAHSLTGSSASKTTAGLSDNKNDVLIPSFDDNNAFDVTQETNSQSVNLSIISANLGLSQAQHNLGENDGCSDVTADKTDLAIATKEATSSELPVISSPQPIAALATIDQRSPSSQESSSGFINQSPPICTSVLLDGLLPVDEFASPILKFTRTRNFLAQPTPLPSSPLLSSNPIVTSVPSSPLLRGGSRAQKMLAMSLKKSADQAKQRNSSASQTPLTSPTCEGLKMDTAESMLSRSGILKGLTTPRSRNRVSFAEAPQIFILSSPDKSPLLSSIDGVPSVLLPETVLAPYSEPDAATEMEDCQEISFSPISQVGSETIFENDKPSEKYVSVSQESGIIKDNIVKSPDTIAPFSQEEEDDELDYRLTSAASSRRKSASPCRRAPIDRSSREALKTSIRLQHRHRLFSDHDEETDAKQDNSLLSFSSSKMPIKQVDLDLSQDQPIAAVELEEDDKVIAETQEMHNELCSSSIPHHNSDLVESSQEPDQSQSPKQINENISSLSQDRGIEISDIILDTENMDLATQMDSQTTSIPVVDSINKVVDDDSERKNIKKSLNHNVAESLNDENSSNLTMSLLVPTQTKEDCGSTLEDIRQTLRHLSSQLSGIPVDLHREVLLETLSVLKPIMH